MPSFDFAIHGSGLLSALLAGVLARDHGKRVARIGRRPSSQRLPRVLDLALPFSAHPANWALTRAAETETRRLLAGLGASEGWSETAVGLVADSAATALGLDHLVHLAHGCGHQVARLPSGWALRRVGLLHPEFLSGKLAEWLAGLGVVSQDEGPVEAAQIVLADDAAILEHFADDRRPAALVTEAMTATLVVAPRGLPLPLQQFPDRGVTLQQRPGNTVLALVRGEADVEARLASTLGGPFPMKRLATTRYRRVIATDGVPLVGQMEGVFVVAGLGEPAAFFAPALARRLAGASEGDEQGWFAARDPSAMSRQALADIPLRALP